MRFENIQQ